MHVKATPASKPTAKRFTTDCFLDRKSTGETDFMALANLEPSLAPSFDANRNLAIWRIYETKLTAPDFMNETTLSMYKAAVSERSVSAPKLASKAPRSTNA